MKQSAARFHGTEVKSEKEIPFVIIDVGIFFLAGKAMTTERFTSSQRIFHFICMELLFLLY